MKKVLVTGGAGYIGSHTVLSLLKDGFDVVVIDDLSNSSRESLTRVEALSKRKVEFIHASLLDTDKLSATFCEHKFDSVIHFAGLKAVGESIKKPLEYYYTNLVSTLNLCQCMLKFNVNKLVFSSSATVYGQGASVPYTEDLPLGRAASPYGQTKVMIEQILQEIVASNTALQVASLRYFNPIGADISGQIGEDPLGIPNNLMPFIAQVAVGKRDKLAIFGGDYPTEDGTCERDYIHVSDLAEGHIKALVWLGEQKHSLYEAFNLGTGAPYSVLDIVKAFIRHTGVDIKFNIVKRRDGDLAAFWADSTKAKTVLGWHCNYTLEDMMKDTWRWQSNNPNGYLGV
ncbi:UDP-glucose 4-epimerase [Pseudoalteromonas sp. MM1]|uniref:UDP-glucose 4-epimerase GalE n=1 Tax=Pseudoalteromonas sp. MM1 TaxID=3036714 RepID=UPI00257378E0|nr:UDP-glucose 4-epimerase GalE [Pseudoalteromonas sp. MM1]BED89346.1 UDP-glucose 4-epimerase [Pseudoalteromonas sp. MM1]